MTLAILVAIAVIVLLGLTGLRIAQEYERGVVFQLGRYMGLRGPGLYWIIPLGIERAVTDGGGGLLVPASLGFTTGSGDGIDEGFGGCPAAMAASMVSASAFRSTTRSSPTSMSPAVVAFRKTKGS